MINGNDYLAHHGIKGQRWGFRRFQNPDGSLTKLGKERYSNPNGPSVSKQAQIKKQQEKDEALKQYLRKHPNKIYKHRMELSEQDVNDIMKKVDFDRKCKDIKRDEWKRTLTKIEDVRGSIDTINNFTKSSVGLWNNTAMLYNAFYDIKVAGGKDVSNMKRMPTIGEGGAKYSDGNKAIKELIKSGNADTIYANYSKMSPAEQKDALNAVRNRDSLYSYTSAGKAEAAENNNSGNNNSGKKQSINGGNVKKGSFESMILNGNYEQAAQKYPEEYEAYVKVINGG